MAIYKMNANNDMDAEEVFHRRILYKFFAISLSGNPTIQRSGIKEYWNFENYFFGKVDGNFLPVIPVLSKMKQITGQSGNVLAFDFVATAFEKFRSFFVMPLKVGRLVTNTPLSTPLPVRGYQNNEIKYNGYVAAYMDRFNSFLVSRGIHEKITGPEDYVQEFFRFYFSSEGMLLKSSYFLSANVPSCSSGLSLEIADLDPSDDQAKIDFIESANFGFYRKAAINAGFLIDKNIPWRLNIDLKSPIIEKRYSHGKASSLNFVDQTFFEYFNKAYTDDLELVQEALFYGYRGIYEKMVASTAGHGHDHGHDHKIPPLPSLGAIAESHSLYYWLGKYVEMKNQESSSLFTEKQLEDIKLTVFSFSSPSLAIDHIAKKFSMPWLADGSLVHERLKREFQENDDFPLDNFSDYVKMVVQNSINSIY